MVEVLVTISLNLLVVAMIIAVGISSLRHIRTIRDNRNLYATASFLNNQFTYWIKQGVLLNTPASSTLEISLPGAPPSTTIITATTTIAGRDTIIIDGNDLISNNINVDNLVFTKMDNSVRIAFTLNTGNPTTTFSATTTVAQRN